MPFVMIILLSLLVLIVISISIQEINAINWPKIAKKLVEKAIGEGLEIGVDTGIQSIKDYYQDSPNIKEYNSKKTLFSLPKLPTSPEELFQQYPQLVEGSKQQKKLLQQKFYTTSFIPYILMNRFNNPCYESINSTNTNNIPLPSSTDAIELHSQGLFLAENGRCVESLAYMNEAIENDEGLYHPYMLHDKGRVLSSMERYDEALETYNKSLSLDPNYSDPWNSRGTIFASLGEFEKALESIDKALQINQTNIPAILNKAFLLTILERYDLAIPYYDFFLTLMPNDVYALNSKAIALVGLGKVSEAIDNLDKAIRIDPKLSKHYKDIVIDEIYNNKTSVN